MEVGTKILIHGLDHQTQFCVSFIALWSQNGRFQTPQTLQVFHPSLFRCSPVVMNLRWPTKNSQKNKRQSWDICEEFSVLRFVTKSKGLRSIKPGMSSPFSESREPMYVSSAMCPQCSRKEWWNKSFGLQSTPTGKWSGFRPRTRWRDYISDLARSRLGVEPAELSEIAVDREVFWVLLELLPPRFSPKEKRVQNWLNQWVCRPTLKLFIYEIVFSFFAKSECCFQII